MARSGTEMAQGYAASLGARAAWFVRARNTADLLAKMGIVGPADRLVVCADDFASEFSRLFRFSDLVFAGEPTAEALLAASQRGPAQVADDMSSAAEDEADAAEAAFEAAEAARLVPEGTPASYAHPAGMGAGRLFWFVESIGCAGLRVPNLREVSAAARSVGAVLVVDNTLPSCFGCNPLAQGADICLEALDRVAAGHLQEKAVAVTVARSITGRGKRRLVRPEAEDAYRMLAFSLGVPEKPSDALRMGDADIAATAEGLASLPARMQAHNDHAHAIAEYLVCHYAVGHVFYPGLSSHPDRSFAPNVLMHGFGPAIDFCLQGDDEELSCDRAARFLDCCSCAHRDQAAGGAYTRVSLIRRGDLGYLRIFAGVDDPLAIVDSLDQALRLFCNPPHA